MGDIRRYKKVVEKNERKLKEYLLRNDKNNASKLTYNLYNTEK